MMFKVTSNRPVRAHRGYSMIELVVAITIGVFLLMGLFTVFQSQRQVSTEASGLAELEDEERLAMTILTDVIQHGGYFPDPLAEDITGALPPDGGNFTYTGGGQVFYGTTVAATSSDTMMVRFKAGPSDPIINCNGGTNTSTTTSAVFVNYFLLTTNAQGISQLGCAVGPDSTTVTAAGTHVMGLVNNVVGLNFSYAVNTTGATGLTPATSVASGGSTANNKCPADTYKKTANMKEDATIPEYDWTNVCAVKVSLTFTNPLYKPVGQPNPTPGQPATIAFERVIVVRGASGIDMVTITPPASVTPPASGT
jgi:type IV pilus assembly protein PilW